MSANSPFPFHFQLRCDFHEEIGWKSHVRTQATRNPDVIRQILANPLSANLGPDPLTILERWEPLASGFMFYLWIIRKGQTQPSFVATDGFLSMFIDPLPNGRHLAGLPDALRQMVADAVARDGGRIDHLPVIPRGTGAPATEDIYAESLIVHRYNDAMAYLRPSIPTLRAVSDDIAAFVNREPTRESLQG